MATVAVYKATNILNGKMYIGQAVDPGRRFAEHKSRDYEKCTSRSHIGRAIKKHGKENFEFKILCWCPDKAYADMVETKLIEAHDTRRVGYNICVGGEGTGSGDTHPKFGRKESEETRRKKSIARLGGKNPNYGRVFSSEIRARMSIAKKGRNVTPEWAAKISAANKGKRRVSDEQMASAIKAAVEKTSHPVAATKGLETLFFPSIKAAARHFDVRDVSVHRWLKAEMANRDGWVFSRTLKNGN